ncbi:hypothetical protein [Edaphobacter aggregans]|uniref:hypothetical protein n=1 Tax=Edaphobacter aggregans TaxID=570835 RepID=UPI00055662A4|nr:hypothetical protein [Edaphobacter aggregans]
MTRYATVLLLLLSLGPLNSQQPSADDARIASQISQTDADFQARTRRFTNPKWTYPAGDLNSVLAATRQQLLDDLPPDAAPLRAYVMQNFPAVIPGVPANQKINMKICGPYLSDANEVLSSLKSVSAYRLDLILDSSPTGALYELTPVAGDKLTRASRGTLTNVWRGVYNYTVAKDGEKTITGTLNLVREKGNLLRCTFVHAGSPSAPLPCELVTGQ